MSNFDDFLVQETLHYAEAYDNFAKEAMSALLLSSPSVHTTTVATVAKVAWEIADAMMEERKKRSRIHPRESK